MQFSCVELAPSNKKYDRLNSENHIRSIILYKCIDEIECIVRRCGIVSHVPEAFVKIGVVLVLTTPNKIKLLVPKLALMAN